MHWLQCFFWVIFWHASRARNKEGGFDFNAKSVSLVVSENSFVGDLKTPLNSSEFSKWWLSNIPFYRSGLSPLFRGLEIGMAHGYLLFGPFALLGPQRNSEQANLIGLLSACGLVVILTICLKIYGGVSFRKEWRSDFPTYSTANPELPSLLKTIGGWNQFTIAFLVGGLGGAFFAHQLFDHFDALKAILNGSI